MPDVIHTPTTTINNASILIDDCYKIMDDGNLDAVRKPRDIQGTPFKFVTWFKEGQLDPFNCDFGALYINEKTKEAIYVARGTYEGGPRAGYDDWDYNRVGLPLKDKCQARINDAVTNVRMMMERYPDYSFSVAGHSLGAFIAQGVARKLNLCGIGFNGPSLEDVATDKFFMVSNYNDLVGRLSFAAPNVLYVQKKEPPPVQWQDKGDIVSSAVDFVGQVFNYVGEFFKDNNPSPDKFHSVNQNVIEKIGNIKEIDYTSIHHPSPDNAERNKLIKDTKELSGATLLLSGEPVCGNAPERLIFPKPSIIYMEANKDTVDKRNGFGLQFTLPLGIPVEGVGNLYKNKIQFNEGGQKDIFTTEDGQRVCGIDENGNPTVYNDAVNDEEPTQAPDAEPQQSMGESIDKEHSREFKIQSLPGKPENTVSTPFAINKDKQKLYMEVLPLKQSIRALHNTAIIPSLELKDPNGAWGMGGALGIFIKTIHPSSDFYEKAVEVSGLGQIEYLSCLYGQWLKNGEICQPGDIVFVQSTFIKDTQAWGIMIEQKDEFNMDVMLANGPTVGIGWPTAYLCTGLPMVVLKAFRPSLKPVIDENTPQGKFWGPLMSYLKLVLEKGGTEKPDTFISKLLKPKGISVASIDEFRNIYSNEIKPVTDISAVPFGAIVLPESNPGAGIMLSDHSIFGLSVENAEYYTDYDFRKRHNPEDFKPAFYWSPVCQ